MVSSLIMALAACGLGFVGSGMEAGGGDVRGMSHRPLSVLLPSIIILSPFIILTLKREKIAMQSSSHS